MQQNYFQLEDFRSIAGLKHSSYFFSHSGLTSTSKPNFTTMAGDMDIIFYHEMNNFTIYDIYHNVLQYFLNSMKFYICYKIITYLMVNL